jgi:hypothetical protein
MTDRITVGQKFRFLKTTTAIALFSPFANNAFLGFHAPGKRAKALYRQELLGEEIQISTADEFFAREAYESVTGWCIVGRRIDGEVDVHFHQKLSDRDDPDEFLEIVKK